MNLFTPQAIETRRKKAAVALDQVLASGDLLIVASGDPVAKPGGLDQTYPFLPHPMYYWLTGSRRQGSAIAYSKDFGWCDYTNPISNAEVVWEGVELTHTQGKTIHDLPLDLQKQGYSAVFLLGQPTDKQKIFSKNADENKCLLLKQRLDEVRRVKDSEEIHLIRRAASIAQKGYQRFQEAIVPGITERELQIVYESEIYRCGAHTVPYETIVGSGRNAAVLHAIPTSKRIGEDELILIDGGVDLHDYCVDITRVFPANGKWSSRQKDIVDLVHQAQTKAIQMCVPGTEWGLVHRAAAYIIADGLRQLKIMKGSVDDLLDSGAISVFFPHGVGHMVGLRVRDVGFEENRTPRKHCGVSLRVDMKIQENHLMTVEPGCYFIRALIEDSEIQSKYNEFISFDEARRWLDFGGVRLEDDILVVNGEPQNLTSIVPKL